MAGNLAGQLALAVSWLPEHTCNNILFILADTVRILAHVVWLHGTTAKPARVKGPCKHCIGRMNAFLCYASG